MMAVEKRKHKTKVLNEKIFNELIKNETPEDIQGSPALNNVECWINLNVIAEHYHKRLIYNDNAMNWLNDHGIIDPEIYETYQIGFVDKTLLDVTSENQKKELVELGILKEDYTEHFNNCITIPAFDTSGILGTGENKQVIQLHGIDITTNKFIKPIILNNVTALFNQRVIKSYDQIILTEDLLDALSLIQLDIKNVVSVSRHDEFKVEYIKILQDHRVKKVIIAFKNEVASIFDADTIKDLLVMDGFKVKVIYPLTLKSWNEELINGTTKSNVVDQIEIVEECKQEEEKIKFRAKKENEFYFFNIDDLTYRLAGVKDIFSPNLKVKIRCEILDKYHRDNLDLYSYRARQNFSNVASSRLDVNTAKIEKDLDKILDYFENEREKKTKPFKEIEELTEEEKEIGLNFLKSKNIFKEIIDDVTTIGYVGEDLNKLLLYLCATSRLTDYPVSVLIISQSATGKSYLVDIVKKLIPAGEVITIHSLSDQALNYIKDLIGKFLAFGEAVFNPEVERQIREMLSSKELSRMVVDKDDKTGELIGKIISKEVNVACVMSTTSSNVHPENASRFFIINADESFLQTQKIHEKQMDKYSPDRYYEKQESIPAIIKKHHASQKLLKKVHVVIPDVMRKLIKFPFHSLRTRRDHERFIDLMACVCFLRQYQKATKQFKDGKEYVECDHIDYDIAKMIMINGALTSTLSEIPEGAIRLYEAVRIMVKEIAETEGLKPEEVIFGQRDVREFTGFGQSWIKQNLRLLVEYEYLNRVRGGTVKGSRGFYKLKSDEDMISIDFSMLPDAETIKKALEEREKED